MLKAEYLSVTVLHVVVLDSPDSWGSIITQFIHQNVSELKVLERPVEIIRRIYSCIKHLFGMYWCSGLREALGIY